MLSASLAAREGAWAAVRAEPFPLDSSFWQVLCSYDQGECLGRDSSGLQADFRSRRQVHPPPEAHLHLHTLPTEATAHT